MNLIKRLFPKAVGLILITAGFLTVMTVSAATANTDNGAKDLANIAKAQEWPLAVDGRFSESLEILRTSEDLAFEPTLGAELSYIANADGTHYVMAASLSSGGVLVGSDTHARGDFIKCEAYTAECIAKVTDDAALIAAAPIWTKF